MVSAEADDPPALEVVICTYNNAAMLDTALDALAAQRPSDGSWRVLVVDNNSTDDTQRVLDRHRIRSQIPSLTSVREPQQGLTHARLRGVRSTTAPWVAFVDDDCILASDWIDRAIHFALAHPDSGAFGGRVIPTYDEPPPPVVARYGWAFAEQRFGDEPRTLDCLVGAGMVVNRAALAASGWSTGPLMRDRIGRRLISGGDVEIALRIAATGRPLWYVPECHIEHRVPARRTTTSYLVRMLSSLGKSDSLADALTWSGSRRSWAHTSLRNTPSSLRTVLRAVPRLRHRDGRRLDALLKLSYEWGRWRGTLATAAALALGRCALFSRAATPTTAKD